jgi:hypothetical protein
MPCVTRQLEASVAARWRERTAGPDERFQHWQTRVGYYRAVLDAVRNRPADAIGVRDVVRRHVRGRQSTLYALTARRDILRAYRTQPTPALRQLADLVPHGPIPQLVAEATVWSFWPARTVWLRELDERYPAAAFGPAVAGLVRALAHWRAAHPELAVHEGLPPLCAVEDMVVLSRHTLSVPRAARLLLRAATTGEVEVPADVPLPRCPVVDDLLVAAAVDRIDTAVGMLLDGPGSREPAVSLLRTAARDLSTVRCAGIAR